MENRPTLLAREHRVYRRKDRPSAPHRSGEWGRGGIWTGTVCFVLEVWAFFCLFCF